MTNWKSPRCSQACWDEIKQHDAERAKLVMALADMTRDRDEWKHQHENLLAIYQASHLPDPPQRSADTDDALLLKLADMIDRGQCGDVWDVNGISEEDHARMSALVRQRAYKPSFSDAQLAEWVQRLDWDTGLTTADEIRQLRSLLQHIGFSAQPQTSGVWQPIETAPKDGTVRDNPVSKQEYITLKDGTNVPADDFWLNAPTWLIMKHGEPV